MKLCYIEVMLLLKLILLGGSLILTSCVKPPSNTNDTTKKGGKPTTQTPTTTSYPPFDFAAPYYIEYVTTEGPPEPELMLPDVPYYIEYVTTEGPPEPELMLPDVPYYIEYVTTEGPPEPELMLPAAPYYNEYVTTEGPPEPELMLPDVPYVYNYQTEGPTEEMVLPAAPYYYTYTTEGPPEPELMLPDVPYVYNYQTEGPTEEMVLPAAPYYYTYPTDGPSEPELMLPDVPYYNEYVTTEGPPEPELMLPDVPYYNEYVTTEGPPEPELMLPDVPYVDDYKTDESQNSTSTTTKQLTIAATEPKPLGDIHYMKQLFDDFIENSDSKIRPVVNQSKPIHVHTKFVPVSIVHFDMTEQKFSLLAYFRVFWTDELIKWKPKDYNGLFFMKIPTTDIWTPNLIILKPFGGDGVIGNAISDITSISWKGGVQWVPDGTYSVVCDVSIQYYPFDEQVCTVSYYMADETYNTLELTHDAEVDMSELSENSAWKVSNVTVKTYLKDDVFYIDVNFHLQRRPNFTTFTLIMPLLMLAFLNVCIFLVPADSGEKGGFAITIFLSYGIFISILSDTLPNNSIQTSYFVIFVSVLLGLSVLSVFYVILQAKMIACMGVKESLIKCFIPEYMKGKEKVDGAQRSMNQFLNASTPSMKQSDAGTAWKMIFHKIDMVLFFIFLVIVLLATTVFFCILLRRVSEFELGIAH